MSVCFTCCVLSGRGLCDWPITRPGECYRLCYVSVCDLETSGMRRPWLTLGCCAREKIEYKKKKLISWRNSRGFVLARDYYNPLKLLFLVYTSATKFKWRRMMLVVVKSS